MKQDKAEAKAVADVRPYGLRKLPVVDMPQVQYLAPDLDLNEYVSPPPAPTYKWREKGSLQRKELEALRDLYVLGNGIRPVGDIAGDEWYALPLLVRTCLLRVAGIHAKSKLELDVLACRRWQEMPPDERNAIARVLRMAKRHLRRTNALTRRW